MLPTYSYPAVRSGIPSLEPEIGWKHDINIPQISPPAQNLLQINIPKENVPIWTKDEIIVYFKEIRMDLQNLD